MIRSSSDFPSVDSRPHKEALRAAASQRDRAGVARVREEWRRCLGEDGILDWAVQHLSPWAVEELLNLGEPVTKEVVMAALIELDEALARKAGCLPLKNSSFGLGLDQIVFDLANSITKSREIWALLLPRVEASMDLRDVAIKCFLRGNLSTSTAPNLLSWDLLDMRQVFQVDLMEALRKSPLPMRGLKLVVGMGGLKMAVEMGEEELESCYLAPLQIAWEEGRPDLCLKFLEQGLSAQRMYGDSLWPTWTLEQAVLDPCAWVATLTGEAEARARQVLNAYQKAGPSPSLEILARAIRERLLEQSLPTPVPFTRGPRF